MDIFRARKEIDLPADVAFAALREFDQWGPRLSSVERVMALPSDAADRAPGDCAAPAPGDPAPAAPAPFLSAGRRYLTITTEGITMRCLVTEVSAAKRYLKIRARSHFGLTSLLLCAVEDLGAGRCRLIREQAYPGAVGKMISTVFRTREAGETEEYLERWYQHAIALRG